MHIIGKTHYLKNLKAELNSKKQITQIFLVIYGLLVPQLLSTVGITGNFIVKGCIVVYISIFLLIMLSYYQEVTKEVNLATFNISNINFHATIGAGAFNYFLFLYILTYHGIQKISATWQSFIFLVFSMSWSQNSKLLLLILYSKLSIELLITELILRI